MEIKIGFSVDWIRGTFPVNGDVNPENFTIEEKSRFVEVKAHGSYNISLESELVTVSWHTEYPEHRVLVQMSGKQLSKARRLGHTDDDLIAWFAGGGARFTRIDFAVDIVKSGGRVMDFYDFWQTERYKARCRQVNRIDGKGLSSKIGETVYLGSRTSTRLVRVYHKGQEQGTPDDDWIRIELEWKKERARQMGKDMMKNGVVCAGLSHLRDFIPRTDFDWFEVAFRDDIEQFNVDSLGRKATNHERWIFEVCLPALADAVSDGIPGVKVALEAIVKSASDRSSHGPDVIITS